AAKKKAAAEAKKTEEAEEEKTEECDEEENPDGCDKARSLAGAWMQDGTSSGFAGGVVIERAGLLQVADQAALLEGLELCRSCRFLEWGYFTEQIPTAMNSLRMGFWVNGIAATSAHLSAAATKQARYSGDLLGMVWDGTQARATQGDFRSTVSFGVANYSVDAFSATFDGGQYSSAARGVKNGSAFRLHDAASGRNFTAKGNLFGHPQAVGQPPPEMAGQFSITGNNYQAGGVFGGAMVSQSGNDL
ncbi:MAG TPA: hypothetical protein DES72_00480, partial [Gammaproteobacteria bacterium]|nr:hypothetical protein [Gammaproteobacteria bacterium]